MHRWNRNQDKWTIGLSKTERLAEKKNALTVGHTHGKVLGGKEGTKEGWMERWIAKR